MASASDNNESPFTTIPEVQSMVKDLQQVPNLGTSALAALLLVILLVLVTLAFCWAVQMIHLVRLRQNG